MKRIYPEKNVKVTERYLYGLLRDKYELKRLTNTPIVDEYIKVSEFNLFKILESN
jgi:hypothetical protein